MTNVHSLTDHEQIRQWADERGAKPACIRGVNKGHPGRLLLDFPDDSSVRKGQAITWREWFESFDAYKLALLVQDRTARGERSHSNKLVDRRRCSARSARQSNTKPFAKSTARRRGTPTRPNTRDTSQPHRTASRRRGV